MVIKKSEHSTNVFPCVVVQAGVGEDVGVFVGALVTGTVGAAVVGASEGDEVGNSVGAADGAFVGADVGFGSQSQATRLLFSSSVQPLP